MNVWDAIRAKRAIRQFTPERLTDDQIERILDAGRRSQSSKNTQPWQFIAIQERDRLEALATAGKYLSPVAQAALCVGIVTPPWSSHNGWIAFDAGQCAAYMQLAAQGMGIGSVIGTVHDQGRARELLGFPDTMEMNVVLSFGHPAPETQRPPRAGARRALSEIIHWETWMGRHPGAR